MHWFFIGYMAGHSSSGGGAESIFPHSPLLGCVCFALAAAILLNLLWAVGGHRLFGKQAPAWWPR